MCGVCPSQKMTKKQKIRRKRTTCQTDLARKKPPKPKRLCISSSVKQRPSPFKHLPRSLDEKPNVHKNGWFCNFNCCASLPTCRRTCGVADPSCYESNPRERLPAVLLALKLYLLQTLHQLTTILSIFYCRYSLYPLLTQPSPPARAAQSSPPSSSEEVSTRNPVSIKMAGL